MKTYIWMCISTDNQVRGQTSGEIHWHPREKMWCPGVEGCQQEMGYLSLKGPAWRPRREATEIPVRQLSPPETWHGTHRCTVNSSPVEEKPAIWEVLTKQSCDKDVGCREAELYDLLNRRVLGKALVQRLRPAGMVNRQCSSHSTLWRKVAPELGP